MRIAAKTIALSLSCALLFASCSTTAKRAFIHRDANVKDYLYFPSREVRHGEARYELKRAINPEVEALLRDEFGSSDLQKTVEKTRTQALIVVQGNRILLEKYGKGYNADSIVTSFSVVKSFDSAMIETLIEAGKIKSVDEPITDYIPELLKRDPRFARVTIRHLLTMSSGIRYEEKPSLRRDDTETYYNPNLRDLAIRNPLIDEEPGRHFHYNNYNPLLLGLIIERATGGSVCS
jgi:CubicO group peptidase (beta-lactamase class C family)